MAHLHFNNNEKIVLTPQDSIIVVGACMEDIQTESSLRADSTQARPKAHHTIINKQYKIFRTKNKIVM